MIRFFIHYGIHFVVPIVIGLYFFKGNKKRVILILLSAILIDLDHLLANPIFDADRCSINFHPLHSYWAMGCYLLLVLSKKTKIIGIGLLLHILADLVDCYLITTQLK